MFTARKWPAFLVYLLQGHNWLGHLSQGVIQSIFEVMVIEIAARMVPKKKWPSGGQWYAPKCVTPGVSAWGHRSSISISISWHFTFHDILHFMTFYISWHLTFQDIWHFMTSDISWHLTFHDSWHFMTFHDICYFISFEIS